MAAYERVTARIEGDFVVFLIGMRVNRPWMVHHVWQVASAMTAMRRELDNHPESGFMGAEDWFGRTTISVQYWRSVEQLMAYAHAKDHAHFPAWRRFNQIVARSRSVGIWHETYCVRAGEHESVYGGMGLFGLARAAAGVAATGPLESASGRLGRGGPTT